MKKTNKTFKRFAAITSASLLAACAVAPVFAHAATSTDAGNTITVTASDGANHTYSAYQIFSGNYSGDVLNDIQWGDAVKDSLLGALQSNAELGGYFADCETAEDVAKALADNEVFSDDGANMQLFAEIVSLHIDSAKTSGEASTNGVTKLPDGYYMLIDSAAPTNPGNNDNSGAKSRYIIKVTANSSYTIDAKHAAPKVDKQVLDETADAETGAVQGWGETADHAINESFQFKLIAEIPANADLKAYETYKLVFNDKMSNGVTFESIESITVNGEDIKAKTEAWSDNTPKEEGASKAGIEWSLTINDVKSHAGSAWGESLIKVEVVYNAHLNQNAVVSNTDFNGLYNAINNNEVKLQYSNNPNSTGVGSGSGTSDELGETPKDTVGVFTYKVTNIKRIETEAGNPLPNATFKLYSDETCTTEIALTAAQGDGGVYYYIPAEAGATGALMTSQSDGTFNIVGLDAGTYYVKEQSTPDGYNLITEPWKIEIKAVHAENAAKTGATMSLAESNAENLSYNYVNKKGTALPGTGGIGTTIFYLGGGAMAAIGGIYLISKRRMRKSEE